MTKLSIHDLMSDVSASKAEADRRYAVQRAAELEEQRLGHETTAAGVAKLFALARFSSVIDGMPTKIDFASSTGHLAGYSASFDDGAWSLRTETCRDQISRSNFSNGGSAVDMYLAQAMGLEWSAQASTALKKAFAIGSTSNLKVAWKNMRDMIPRHAIVASMSWGSQMADVFDLPHDDDFAVEWMGLLMDEKVRPDHSPLPGAGTVIETVAMRRDVAFLELLLQVFPLRSLDMNLHDIAVAGARNHSIPVLELLDERGIDLLGKNDEGGTLIHEVLSATGRNEVHSCADTIEWLLGEGLDPTVKDSRGHSAIDLVEDMLEGQKGYSDDEKSDMVRLCRMLDVSHDIDTRNEP
jgi:hypothetical protein